MTKEETAFRKRLEALPQMTDREAMEMVLGMAETYSIKEYGLEPDCEAGKKQQVAIWKIRDYMNDLIRDYEIVVDNFKKLEDQCH